MIVIVDYGMGNLGSILNMLRKIGADAVISSDKAVIARADKLILPGVGAFDNGMANLSEMGLLPALNAKVTEEGAPVLGICLGMQLLARGSEEGTRDGLGWIEGRAVRFRYDASPARMKIPHMGWNVVRVGKRSCLFEEMYPDPRFYFVHSYHVICDRPDDVLATTRYGIDFTSSVERGNIMGVQFHPEKSHKYGMKLLANFALRARRAGC